MRRDDGFGRGPLIVHLRESRMWERYGRRGGGVEI